MDAAYKSSESKIIEEAAHILRRHIVQAHRDSEQLPWPPTADFLSSGTRHLPEELNKFLAYLLTGKPVTKTSSKTHRKIDSISQDICQAATNGKWTMPKHLLLGLTLRHLTGSAEIVTLINHLGHCSAYSTLLELETAMHDSNAEKTGTVPPAIQRIGNAVTHLCWDNFDLNEETPSGAGTTHTAHGIIMN